jgi:ATP-dependent DNA helicase DinG
MNAAVRHVLGPGGLCAAAFPGYEPRPGQLAMAERIAAAIDGDERLLVEAGTGTGKTLAYLIPALLSGRKVVVSTGTKTLQDQIATVDIPRLAAILDPTGALARPLASSWAVMKGLQNYVCLRRLAERDRQRTIDFGGPRAPVPRERAELDRVLTWVSETATGDRADLSDLPDDSPLWRDVQATPETRIGPRCAFFEKCFVTQMRRRAADAQLVIVNHHLYFADLALRSQWPEAQVLPPHEVVIFDEAHQIEDVATEFFGLHVSTQRMFALARDLARAAEVSAARAQSASGRLNAVAAALADALRDRLPAPRPGLDEVRVPIADDLWSGPALARYHELDGVLEEIATWLDGESDAVRESQHPAELAALGRRATALRGDLGLLVGSRGRGNVRWIAATPRNVSLHASPIHVGPALARAFDALPGPIIFTSATLTVAGSFSFVRERVGLGDAAAEASFPSPFRYGRQALLYVATDLPDPRRDNFAAAAAARMAELGALTRGRALFLFTSFKNLRAAEAHLRAKTKLRLLVQGEKPRHLLLAELREKIGSVLLATQSFWEGVDVPGEALSLVVIDKIPFDVPDDPLTAARIEHLREGGGEPFNAFQIPRAALSLKQGFGRLIRGHGDFGIVALLDGRLLQKPYGRDLLATLPAECPRTESFEEVVHFWEHGPVASADRVRAELAARAAAAPQADPP